jgi:hypothetical protein
VGWGGDLFDTEDDGLLTISEGTNQMERNHQNMKRHWKIEVFFFKRPGERMEI